jgi:hypothetical protein
MDALTAIHEAGHAVVAFVLDLMPEEVSIIPDDDSNGHMEYLPGQARNITRASFFGRTEADRDLVMRWLLASAAGPASQAMHMRGHPVCFLDEVSWRTFGGGQDFKKAEMVRSKAGDLLTADLDDVASEAFDYLAQPEIWAAVEFLAQDLMRFRTLNYEGIEAAIYYRDAIRGQTVADRLGIGQRKFEESHREHSGLRPISHEEAWRRIAAKSPLGALQVAGWRRAAKHGPEVERR